MEERPLVNYTSKSFPNLKLDRTSSSLLPNPAKKKRSIDINKNDSELPVKTLIYRSSWKSPSSSSTVKTSNEDFVPAQFEKAPPRIPIGSICLASFLCLYGSTLILFGIIMRVGGYMGEYAELFEMMVFVGFLMFIPGAYHVGFAYLAYKNRPGYSFDEMPEFN